MLRRCVKSCTRGFAGAGDFRRIDFRSRSTYAHGFATRRAGMRKLPLKNLIARVAVIAAIALLIHEMAQQYLAVNPRPTDLSKLTFAQALAHCRANWTAWHYDQAPLALAWHPHGVDWYVLEGEDTGSMRHFACTGSGVERGQRYRLPAQGGEQVAPAHNLFDLAAATPDSGLLAYEAIVQAGTGAPIQRIWQLAGTAQMQPAGAPAFPALFARPPPGLEAASQTLLVPLAKKNWVQQHKDLFALLATQMQPATRVAALDFNESAAYLTILGPIPRGEGDPAAPFGAAQFDEYGVRRSTDWTAAETSSGFCRQGYSLQQVEAQFRQHREANNPQLLSATFRCAGEGTGEPVWKLRLPNRRNPA